MIITKSLNSYHFYHRGYVCSVGSALKLSLDTYSKSKRTTLHFGKVTAKVLTYFEKNENSVLRMVNQELFGFLLNYICAYANDSMWGIVK